MNAIAKTISIAAAAFTLAGEAAHAQKGQEHMDMKPMMQKNSQKMMSMPMTGTPDVDFATMMREHHKGGVEMAQWELEHGKDPKMKEMARKILASQKKDIAEFDRWLSSHGKDKAASKQSK